MTLGIDRDSGLAGRGRPFRFAPVAFAATLLLAGACSSSNNNNNAATTAPTTRAATTVSSPATRAATAAIGSPAATRAASPAAGSPAATRAASPAAGSPAATRATSPVAGSPAAVAGPAGSYGTITVDAGKPVVIGMSASLSGGTANLGKFIDNGVRLAAGQKATIKGHAVQVDSQDDGCGGPGSVSAANHFVSDASVAGVIGAMCSSGCVPSEQVYNEKHLVAISPSCTAPNVTQQGFDDILRVIPNDALQGAGQSKFAKDTIKSTKVFLINDQSIYAKALQDAFKKNYADNDHKVVGEEVIKVGDTDFSALVSKIQAANPDLINFFGFVPEGTLLLQQARKAGIKSAYMSDDGLKEPDDFIKKAQGAAEGAYVTNGANGKAPTYQKFVDDYKAKYNVDPGIFSDNAYDATNLLMATIESVAQDQGGKLVIDKKALINALKQSNAQGITGPISFETNGDRKGGSVVISQVKGDAFTEITTFQQ